MSYSQRVDALIDTGDPFTADGLARQVGCSRELVHQRIGARPRGRIEKRALPGQGAPYEYRLLPEAPATLDQRVERLEHVVGLLVEALGDLSFVRMRASMPFPKN